MKARAMQKTHRFTHRRIALLALALATFGVLPAVADEAYPTRPITLIVPFSPGGGTDIAARMLATRLGIRLGKPVVVDNRAGAGGLVGADLVAKAKPDGYTLLMGAVHHTIATSVYKKLPYDFQKDLAPITTVALVPNVLVVSATTPATDV